MSHYPRSQEKRRALNLDFANQICELMEVLNIEHTFFISPSRYGSCYVTLSSDQDPSSHIKLRVADHPSITEHVNPRTGQQYTPNHGELYYDDTGHLVFRVNTDAYLEFWLESKCSPALQTAVNRLLNTLQSVNTLPIPNGLTTLAQATDQVKQEHVEQERREMDLRHRQAAEFQAQKEAAAARALAEKMKLRAEAKAKARARRIPNSMMAENVGKFTAQLAVDRYMLTLEYLTRLRDPVDIKHRSVKSLLRKGNFRLARVYNYTVPDGIPEPAWRRVLMAQHAANAYPILLACLDQLRSDIAEQNPMIPVTQQLSEAIGTKLKDIAGLIEIGSDPIQVLHDDTTGEVRFSHPYLNDPDPVTLSDDEAENRQRVAAELDNLRAHVARETLRQQTRAQALKTVYHPERFTQLQFNVLRHLIAELDAANQVILRLPGDTGDTERWIQLYQTHEDTRATLNAALNELTQQASTLTADAVGF